MINTGNYDFQSGEVLLIDKPYEWTSFDVVNYIRSLIKRVQGIKKIKVGHAGTLDPLATGLLIICTGKFTKRIEEFQGMDKVYVGSMHFGATTPSFDKETEIDKEFDISNISDDELIGATTQFKGNIKQIPPVYSAIKIDGKRAFKYARQNDEVELKARDVRINSFDIFNINLPNIDFAVSCSKGTYIRSLVRDFAESLKNGAHLTDLRRTAIGEFNVNNALNLADFKKTVLKEAGLEDTSDKKF